MEHQLPRRHTRIDTPCATMAGRLLVSLPVIRRTVTGDPFEGGEVTDLVRQAREDLVRVGLLGDVSTEGVVPDLIVRSWRRSLSSSVDSAVPRQRCVDVTSHVLLWELLNAHDWSSGGAVRLQPDGTSVEVTARRVLDGPRSASSCTSPTWRGPGPRWSPRHTACHRPREPRHRWRTLLSLLSTSRPGRAGRRLR